MHGDQEQGLLMQGESGEKEFINSESIIEVLGDAPQLQCVFFSTCNSSSLAYSVTEFYPAVFSIGILGKADINIAVAYSETYFEALFSGKSYFESYEYANVKYGDRVK